MKKALIGLCLLLLVACGPKPQKTTTKSPRAAEQNISVAKTAGDPTTIWFWNIPSQSSFDGISVETAAMLEGPYTDMSLTIAKTDMSVTFPAPSKAMFYRPYYWKGSTKNRVAVSQNFVSTTVAVPVPPNPTPGPEPLGPAPVITAR